MSDDNIISMSKFSGDATYNTPKQALIDAAKELKDGGELDSANKILILALNDKGCYDISFIQSGMKMSECISLCEVAKTIFLREMEYIE